MRYLVVAPQLGFEPDGSLLPGGLLQFGRCVVRALASFPQVEKLGIFSQLDHAGAVQDVQRMLRFHAHPALRSDVKCFGGNRSSLAFHILASSLRRDYDRIMYLLINQSVLSALPFHLPYEVWEIGEELFHPVSALKERSLRRADRLLSISQNTAEEAARHIPGLKAAGVVHLCLEPPLFAPIPQHDPVLDMTYQPGYREPAVLVVANMHASLLYKGHQQLIDAWPIVVSKVPDAELWLVGDGDGRAQLEARAQTLPASVAEKIIFWGRLNGQAVDDLFKRGRIFAMPSAREGFGLVFVEAARYGVPCIGGKYDAVKEVIVDNETGLLVEQEPRAVANACLRLLKDENLAKQMGDAGRLRYLQMFQYDHFRQRLSNALELSTRS